MKYFIYAKYTPHFILFRFGVKYDHIHQINQFGDLIFSINVDNLRHKVDFCGILILILLT